MQYAFWRAGGAGRVQNEQWVLSIHRLARTIVLDVRLGFMQPHVPAVLPLNICARIAHDQNFLERCNAVNHCCSIDVRFERYPTTTTNTLVGRNDDIRIAVNDTTGECIWREAPKDHRVNCPDTRAGQHRDGGLRNHWHVYSNPVALVNAYGLQDVGEAAYPAVKVGVADRKVAIGVVSFPDNRCLIGLVFKVPVDAVVANIEFAVFIPANMQIIACEGNVLDLGKRLRPIDNFRLLCPEIFVVVDGPTVHVEVFLLADQAVFLEIVVDGVYLAHRSLHSVGTYRPGRLPVGTF